MLTLDKRLIYSILLVYLVLAACAPRPGSIPNTGERQTPENQRNLTNTKWMLVSFSEAGVETPVIKGSAITLEINAEGQAGGSGGCNSYSAHYEVQANMLSFGEITRTLMACEQEGIGQQEENFVQALATAGRFEQAGDRLMIWYNNGQSVLNWVKLNELLLIEI